MEPISLEQLAQAVGDPVPHQGTITHICTDSRQITPGCLFVALQGERFDGHDFVPAALEQGAAAAVVHRPVEAPPGKLIRVPDTQRALLEICLLYTSRCV